MNTNTSPSSAKVLETRYVWAETMPEAMALAVQLEWRGWKIQGNPAPMTYNGKHGTGVSVTRISDA